MQVLNSSVARPWKLEQNTSGQASRQASRASRRWKLEQKNMTKKGPFFGPQNVRKSRRAEMDLPSNLQWFCVLSRSIGCFFLSASTKRRKLPRFVLCFTSAVRVSLHPTALRVFHFLFAVSWVGGAAIMLGKRRGARCGNVDKYLAFVAMKSFLACSKPDHVRHLFVLGSICIPRCDCSFGWIRFFIGPGGEGIIAMFLNQPRAWNCFFSFPLGKSTN